MNVGEYVRFDYHRVSVPIQIARITETHYDDEDDSICYSTDIGLVIDESNLVKEPSPDIIDLIEVGDYVNGRKVVDKQYHYTDKDNYDMGEWCIFYGNVALGDYQYDIKSIVTKESFKSMEYKVGE